MTYESETRLLLGLIDHLKNNTGGFETDLIEVKHNNVGPETFGEWISGISNSCVLKKKDVGYVIFGIDDITLEMKGMDCSAFNIKASGNQDMQIYLRATVENCDFQFLPLKYEERDYLIVKIYPALSLPSRYKQESYIREGKNTSKLKNFPEMERRLWSNFIITSFWEREALGNLSDNHVLELLDYSSYFRLSKQLLPDGTEAILKHLESEKFIKHVEGAWVITNLGGLLLANNLEDFPQLKQKAPRVITYDSASKLDSYIKDETLYKGYINGFEPLINFITAQIPEPEIITGIYREKKEVYPVKALRELIANCLIHQDCEISGMSPIVDIFRNRIEITNPGTCLVDINKLIEANSQTRNESIVNLMRKVFICEARGSGIDRTISEVEEYILPAPKFENHGNSFTATIYSYKKYEELTYEERLRALVQHVKLQEVKNEFATNESIRKRFGLNSKNGSSAISKLIILAKDKCIIRNFDPNSDSKKFAKYRAC